MIYVFTDTIPPGTTKANARTTSLKLTRGVVHKVDFFFPAGCNGLAHVQVWEGLHQVWPTNPQGSFAGNAESVTFTEHYEIAAAPHRLTMRTWNTDTVYEHTVTLRVGLLPRWAVLPAGAAEGLVQSLKALIVRRD